MVFVDIQDVRRRFNVVFPLFHNFGCAESNHHRLNCSELAGRNKHPPAHNRAVELVSAGDLNKKPLDDSVSWAFIVKEL